MEVPVVVQVVASWCVPFLFVRSLLEEDAVSVFLSFSLAVSDLKGPVAFRDFGAVSLEVSFHCRHVADRKKQFIFQSLLGGVLW
jgi:hypothetical protein